MARSLLGLDAFIKVADLLTHYCLDLVMTKWSNVKIIGLAIEEGEEEAIDRYACPLACENLSLPDCQQILVLDGFTLCILVLAAATVVVWRYT